MDDDCIVVLRGWCICSTTNYAGRWMVLQVADVYETVTASAGVCGVATRALEEAVLVSFDSDALACRKNT